MAARTSLTGVSISDGYRQQLIVGDDGGITATVTKVYDGNGTATGLSLSTGDTVLSDDLVLPKTTGIGIKVDEATPTFGFRDILGNVTQLNIGATKPSFATYQGGLKQFQFAATEEEFFEYHIPHDHVPGTDVFLHVHWSHIGTLVTGGTLTFGYEISYAKSHNQAIFSSPVTGSITGTPSTTQFQQILSEIQISAASPSGSQIDTDNIEPDGLIMCRFELTANDLTVSGGGVPDPFIHYVDIHYQSTNMATKSRTPDFYA